MTLIGLLFVTFATGTLLLRGSLPRLEGEAGLQGLREPVTVERDSLGVPTIEARDRIDAALALGFLHAQDRFFQMDLLRRRAAGSLAALFGPALLSTDRDVRRHRFRERAEWRAAATRGRDREILLAYTEGVNEGLAALHARPFEYFVLRQKPEPWRPADTFLCLYAMFLDLSLSTATTEASWACVHDVLPPELAALLLPQGNRWEAPLEEGEVPGVILPDSTLIDLRTSRDFAPGAAGTEDENSARSSKVPAGSNNWAVAGALSGHGDALLANDMHLGHALPNVWYRARLEWPENGAPRSLIGVTLPGAPALVAGSNGEVAWGFTNSQGDWCDLVRLERAADDSTLYRTPDGWKHFTHTPLAIEVAGASPDTLWLDETVWGPVYGHDADGNSLALRWTAYDSTAVNLNLLELEEATDVDAVVGLAATLGIPEQNLLCADRSGRIAWTVAGAIPRRIGFDGRLPVSWADGSRRWDGYYDAPSQPRLIDPREGRLWSANNRVTAGEDLRRIGDGGYVLGARARQIRDALRALDHPLEKDMLVLQLDDRALFMGEWRRLLLSVLQRNQPSPETARARFESIVRDEWSGHAGVESVAYRLVREATENCVRKIYAMLTAPCRRADPRFVSSWLPYRHAVCWELLTQEPPNLLTSCYPSWDALVLEAIDETVEEATADGAKLRDHTWGARNTVEIVHPFCRLLPWLRRWLAVPPLPLPGDSWMPRVQHPRRGASERLVVSPGHEEDGIFEMPGGESGHPFSRFFTAGTRAWAEGKPTPLLPGPARYRLTLVPR